MKPVTIGEIENVVGGKLKLGSRDTYIECVSTDTRTLNPGDFFIALVGERFDGHEFLSQAFQNGALGALISKEPHEEILGDRALILVKDTLEGLQRLAKWNRRKANPLVIGVTGSVGKTTTKDMIAGILSTRFKTLKTTGNFNNEIGVPLTLLSLDETYQMAVVEMGMRGLGQIRALSEIAEPNLGVITNIGPSHLELLGSLENIAKAKSELVGAINKDGVAILNEDDDFVRAMGRNAKGRIITYGLRETAHVRALNIKSYGEEGSFFTLAIGEDEIPIKLSFPGRHNVYNALAAASVGFAVGMDLETISRGIENFKASPKRLSILETLTGLKVIDDTYNASPASVKAALDILVEISGDRRMIAVLGDMFELGEFSKEGHIEVGRALADKGVQLLLGVGELSKRTVEEAKNGGVEAFWHPNNEEAWENLKGILRQDDVILVKGSRAMEMEYIVERLSTLEYI